MKFEVFISKGGDESTAQRAFVDAVIVALKMAGITSRIMYENEWSYEQPLKFIKKIIGECDGLLVIAYTRSEFEKGKELRGDKVKELNNIKLPTTWTHIEGAIAYTYELPIWILAESGLKTEGLIEKGYDWNVYWSDLDVEEITSEKFRGYLQSWKKAMEERRLSRSGSEPDVDLSKLGIGKLISMISVPQLWKLIGVMLTILTLVAGGSYKLGAGKWPWREEPNKQMQPTQKTRD